MGIPIEQDISSLTQSGNGLNRDVPARPAFCIAARLLVLQRVAHMRECPYECQWPPNMSNQSEEIQHVALVTSDTAMSPICGIT